MDCSDTIIYIDSSNVVLDCNYKTLTMNPGDNYPAIIIGSGLSNIEIKNIGLLDVSYGAGQAGIEIGSGCSNINIHDNVIDSEWQKAIDATNGADITVKDNTISARTYAVNFDDVSNGLIDNNIITIELGNFIRLGDSNDIDITNNDCTNSVSGTGGSSGIRVNGDSYNNVVSYNTLDTYRSGIALSESPSNDQPHDNSIHHNDVTVRETDLTGIALNKGYNNEFYSNTVNMVNGGVDYSVLESDDSNTFRNSGFDSGFMYIDNSNYKYNDQSSGNIWLTTTPNFFSTAEKVTRTNIASWNINKLEWTDDFDSTDEVTYVVSGLTHETIYDVYINGDLYNTREVDFWEEIEITVDLTQYSGAIVHMEIILAPGYESVGMTVVNIGGIGTNWLESTAGDAMDEELSTSVESETRYAATLAWTDWIYFTPYSHGDPKTHNGIRFNAWQHSRVNELVVQIDTDMTSGENWVEVYRGDTFPDREWFEVSFTETELDSARLAIEFRGAVSGISVNLYEFQFRKA